MSGDAERAAWADYWTGSGGVRPACLPNAKSGVEAAQRAVWSAFAETLPRRARVLDLGTGDGAVLRWLAARRDLDLIGVDSAPTLPRAAGKIRLMANVAAEKLPFADGQFDAVVSQFGYEYADTAKVAAEVGRILRPRGSIHLIVHHAGGPIVAHNRIRRDALAWLTGGEDLIGRARALMAARRVSPLPTPDAFRAAIREAQLRYGPGSGADELAEAVWRTLEGGRVRPAVETAAMLDTLALKARAEMLRIDSLLRAARDAAAIDLVAGELAADGVDVLAPRPLFEEGVTQPFAWLIDGRKHAG